MSLHTLLSGFSNTQSWLFMIMYISHDDTHLLHNVIKNTTGQFLAIVSVMCNVLYIVQVFLNETIIKSTHIYYKTLLLFGNTFDGAECNLSMSLFINNNVLSAY